MNKVFENDVYERQRENIERLAEKNPNDWFFKSEMQREPQRRTGFAPLNGKCYYCGKDITKGDKAITVEKLGNHIITGCPYCNRSYCD